jgi:hypothetical protein
MENSQAVAADAFPPIKNADRSFPVGARSISRGVKKLD